MTWIIHKGDRSQIFNTDMSQSITVSESKKKVWNITVWFGTIKVDLDYPNEKECKQGLSYLLESIRRGDRIVSI